MLKKLFSIFNSNNKVIEELIKRIESLEERINRLETKIDAMRRTFLGYTQKSKLTTRDIQVLVYMYKNKNPISATELGKALNISRSTASLRLNKLYYFGLVKKRVENRITYFFLTEYGKELAKAVIEGKIKDEVSAYLYYEQLKKGEVSEHSYCVE